MLGLVLEADHPQRDHRPRVVERAHPCLDQPVVDGEERAVVLRRPDDDVGVELELADRRAHRPGEHAGLERRHAQVAIELRAPRRVVGLDQQAQDAVADLVASGGPVGRAPVRQVVGEPVRLVESRPVEVVLRTRPRSRNDRACSRRSRSRACAQRSAAGTYSSRTPPAEVVVALVSRRSSGAASFAKRALPRPSATGATRNRYSSMSPASLS